jgi:hypothetical protein
MVKAFIFLHDNYTQDKLLKHNINHCYSIWTSYLTINVFSSSATISFKTNTVYTLRIIYVTDETAAEHVGPINASLVEHFDF